MTEQDQCNHDLALLHQNVQKLNEQWNIVDGPVRSHKPVIGGLVTLLKRCIRKSIYWLIHPYWEQQIQFNATVAAAVSDLYRLQSDTNTATLTTIALNESISTTGPRIIQLVSSLNFGDAVGNEVIAFKRTLQEQGYATEIYTNNIHKKIAPGTAKFYHDMPRLNERDLVIYHFASECDISKDLKDFPCKVVLRYHNVTPPEFFHGYDSNAERATTNGLKQVKEMRPYIDFCLPVSKFNMEDLKAMGYDCPMEVLPILIRFDDYAQEPDQSVIDKYTADGRTNLLFVGRMAPNKKVEDVISAFAAYKEKYDRTARLFLVGSFQEEDKYYQQLQKHIKQLGVEDVIFPGHISFAAILSYYRIADVFLCMSEHEGFCVPLVEAMYFDVPVVAYDKCAVPDTLGHSGVVVSEKNYDQIAQIIHKIVSDEDVKERIIGRQNTRLKDFDLAKLKVQFIKGIERSRT